MKKLLLLLSLAFVPGLPVHENDWSDYLVDNNIVQGEREYVLPDGRRVDILNTDVAYEVDFVKKWTSGIGQALGYAVATNSDPGLILLMKHGEDEYYNAALTVVTDLRRRGYTFHLIVVNVDNGKVWKL